MEGAQSGRGQSLTLEESLLLKMLPNGEEVKDFLHPLLGFLLYWETKGIFQFSMTLLSICLLPFIYSPLVCCFPSW